MRLTFNHQIDNVLDYFEDDSAEVIEMEALREKFTEHVTKEVEETLTQLKFELDDKRTLSRVIGLGNRLEAVSFRQSYDILVLTITKYSTRGSCV